MPLARYSAEVAGRCAFEALAGEGEVCAVFRRGFYVRSSAGRYACVGDRSLGRGPLNALVTHVAVPALGAKVAVGMDGAAEWRPARLNPIEKPNMDSLRAAAAGRIPEEGLGCLIVGAQNALANHAQPALESIDEWLAGNRLGAEIGMLVGLGPGLTPSGDDYLGGVLVALRGLGRNAQAESLWRWLQPRLAASTSAISAAHLQAAAQGEAHEALHGCLLEVFSSGRNWGQALGRLDAVGHCSGWDALAGVAAVVRN
jgi:hypothetical protein